MEIQNPKEMTDTQLYQERVAVIRELSRLTVYLSVLNDVRNARTPEVYEAEVIPITNLGGLYE